MAAAIIFECEKCSARIIVPAELSEPALARLDYAYARGRADTWSLVRGRLYCQACKPAKQPEDLGKAAAEELAESLRRQREPVQVAPETKTPYRG